VWIEGKAAGLRPVLRFVEVRPLPPGFAQVFILKEVKVLCFDTDLEVFILKAVATQRFVRGTLEYAARGKYYRATQIDLKTKEL
jgi:hypothetical protein